MEQPAFSFVPSVPQSISVNPKANSTSMYPGSFFPEPLSLASTANSAAEVQRTQQTLSLAQSLSHTYLSLMLQILSVYMSEISQLPVSSQANSSSQEGSSFVSLASSNSDVAIVPELASKPDATPADAVNPPLEAVPQVPAQTAVPATPVASTSDQPSAPQAHPIQVTSAGTPPTQPLSDAAVQPAIQFSIQPVGTAPLQDHPHRQRREREDEGADLGDTLSEDD